MPRRAAAEAAASDQESSAGPAAAAGWASAGFGWLRGFGYASLRLSGLAFLA